MKKEEIKKLKYKINISPPFQKAHYLKKLFEKDYHDMDYYRKFFNESNAAIKAIIEKIIRTIEKNKKQVKEIEKIKEIINNNNLNKDKRFALYEKISNFDVKEKKEIILNGLYDESMEIRNYLSNSIAKNQELFPREDIIKLINNPLWTIRREGIYILGKRRDSYLLNFTEKILEEKNADIKITFLEAIDKIKIKTIPSIVYKFKNDESLWVRKKAERILLKFNH